MFSGLSVKRQQTKVLWILSLFVSALNLPSENNIMYLNYHIIEYLRIYINM